jgi:membrane protein implicated in regulation of membrane protease activity
MSWEILGIGAIVLVFVLIAVFWKSQFVRSYWKYALILLPALVVLVLKLLTAPKDGGKNPKAEQQLQNDIQEVKEKIIEAQKVASVEVTAARAKDNETQKKLIEIKAIPDVKERRRRLAELVG